MKKSDSSSNLSLRSSQSMSQFAVAIALMSIIPMLSLFAIGMGAGVKILPDKLGLFSLIMMLVAMVVGAIAGYMILLRQENSIARLSSLIVRLEKGDVPVKADLEATTSDFRVIEQGMNMVLTQFSSDVAKIYARADLIGKVLNEYNNTLQSLSFVASLGLLDDPEPGELAKQRFEDIQAAIIAGRKKIDAILDETDSDAPFSLKDSGKKTSGKKSSEQ